MYDSGVRYIQDSTQLPRFCVSTNRDDISYQHIVPSLGVDESNYSQRLPKFCPSAIETFVRLAEGGFAGDA